MTQADSRYPAQGPARAAQGWTFQRLTPASRLFCANGMRTGADGRIYVAQGPGSQVSAVHPATGAIEVICPKGGDIVGPDDLAFDSSGNLYVTEVFDGRVSVREADGRTRILRDDLPNANGITFHEGRLFVDECRQGGRLLELDLQGGEPRVVLENLPLPNALAPGPDGLLYFPVLGANEIWRVSPNGGPPERVAGELGVPDAVKFDSKGRIVSTQVHSGEVLRIDPRTGERTVLATLDPGLDNLTFVGERLFVSHLIDGRITEILADGGTRALVPGNLIWPLGLATGSDGRLYVADGFAFYAISPEGRLERLAHVFEDECLTGVRGIASLPRGAVAATTWDGKVAVYQPRERTHKVLAEGLDQLYGVAVAPDGAIVVAEYGAGRVLSIRSGKSEVLAEGLDGPMDVAFGPDGACFVSESLAGRVVQLQGRSVEPVWEGLRRPHGIAWHGTRLFAVDAAAQQLLAIDRESGRREVIATDLPVGAPPGVTPKPLRAVPWFCGPLGPFSSLAVGADGTLYVSGDAEGSVLAVRPAVTSRRPG